MQLSLLQAEQTQLSQPVFIREVLQSPYPGYWGTKSWPGSSHHKDKGSTAPCVHFLVGQRVALQLGRASSPCKRHWGKHGLSGRSPFHRWNPTGRAALGAGWGSSAAAAAAGGARCRGDACQGPELCTAAKRGAGSPGPVCAEHHEGQSGSCDLFCAHHGTPEPSPALGTSHLAQVGAAFAGKGTRVSRCGPGSEGDAVRTVCAWGRCRGEGCPWPPCPESCTRTSGSRRCCRRWTLLTSSPGAAPAVPSAAPAPGQSQDCRPRHGMSAQDSSPGTCLGSRKAQSSLWLPAEFLCRHHRVKALLWPCTVSTDTSPPLPPGLMGPLFWPWAHQQLKAELDVVSLDDKICIYCHRYIFYL